MPPTYELLADLPLTIEAFAAQGLTRTTEGGDFTRRTTVYSLSGGGETGAGEDVIYEPRDHEAIQAEDPARLTAALQGEYTLRSFSAALETVPLFPVGPPTHAAYRLYRRWAFESAALDLALRQAGKPLHEVLGREPAPLTFVVSQGLGNPSSVDAVRGKLAHYPGLRFKLDAAEDWDEALIADLQATGAVDTVDYKGFYRNTPVDLDPDAALYERIARGIPDAWLEDAWLDENTGPALEPYRDRLTWDEPIHSVADIDALAFPPRTINVKPSRVGSLEALCTLYDTLAERGIAGYAGGQYELGPGRAQNQYLAAIFHPDGPNDIAPLDYEFAEPPAGLPTSPWPLPLPAVGFGLS